MIGRFFMAVLFIALFLLSLPFLPLFLATGVNIQIIIFVAFGVFVGLIWKYLA